ncbi:DUF1592 domain-containing protein [soil metagenome]
MTSLARVPAVAGILLLAAVRPGVAAEPAATAAAFFEQHCVQCHGADKQKGDVRLDTLRAPEDDPTATETWALILDVLESGDMPPEDEPQPDAGARKAVASEIAGTLGAVAHAAVPALRRLNRTEYEHTIHDLLGIDVPLAEMLPEDSSVQGFDNVATGLGISPVLMERYLEAADVAFEATIRRIRPLPPETRRAILMDIKENKESVDKKKGGVIEKGGALVKFTPGWPPARIDACHPIEDGVYRCRVAVWPHDPGGRTLSLATYVGPLFGTGKRRFQGVYDVTGSPGEPRIIEFTTRMDEGDTIHLVPWIYPDHVTWRDKHEKRPGIGIVWAETHGPLDQEFPTVAQNRLFGDGESLSMEEGDPRWMRHRKGVKDHYVESAAPREDAERIIRDLVPRAFRRPVDPALADQFVALTLGRLDEGRTFEQAVRAGVTAVLCSPHFLLLNSEPEVDDYSLASRLSYFLWASLPDGALMDLAAQGKLGDPAVRRAQVARMLEDSKIDRFVDRFTGQWLDLHAIEDTTPDTKLYPEFDELLQESMLRETRGFFEHVLANDLGVMTFVDSDFAILNERLANHYGIDGVNGHEHSRVVPLPEESVRGGILTHGSILKVTANGTTTSPILRGVWVLDHLLGQPAPPPPPGVPAVEPDIRGAVTIREQLDQHRANPDCARCHTRIDPPGYAMEGFDPIGGERTWYRSLGEGERLPNKVAYTIGPDVETDSTLPGGREFTDFRSFRALLLEERDRVARALAGKLLVFGSGRPLGVTDRASVDAVVEAAGEGLGLRSMIHAVVETDMFLRE